jgi:ribosomal protein L11 methyltransferase
VRQPRDAWLELSVSCDIEAVEAVSEILGRVASGGTSVEPAFDLVDEGLGARIDVTRPAVVRGYVPLLEPGARERAVAEATDAIGHLQAFDLRPIGDIQTRVVHESDWAEAWKAHFPVMRVGQRLVIRPTWRRHRAAPNDVVISLDPGMAFGTGLHPTTRLSLAAIETVAERGELDGRRVLDVGCGSGILSIAAARLDARSVLGVDTDPVAVEATTANVARNGLTATITAQRGTVPTGDAPFDVVVANLIASLLIELAAPLRDELSAGGILLASGIFRDRESEVRAAFGGAGLDVRSRTSEGDWVALESVRPSGS